MNRSNGFLAGRQITTTVASSERVEDRIGTLDLVAASREVFARTNAGAIELGAGIRASIPE
jgi:hypothetical protein